MMFSTSKIRPILNKKKKEKGKVEEIQISKTAPVKELCNELETPKTTLTPESLNQKGLVQKTIPVENNVRARIHNISNKSNLYDDN
jgi:hypothetical protein